MSQGLFHGAIMESGVALLPYLIADTSEMFSTVSVLSPAALVFIFWCSDAVFSGKSQGNGK